MPAKAGQPKGDAGKFQRHPHGKPQIRGDMAQVQAAAAATALLERPDNMPASPEPLYHTYDQPKPEGAWFDEEAAQKAVDFIQNLRHFSGEHAAVNFWLLPWQVRLVREVFGWKMADGTRLYRKVYVEVPRKSGKSTLAAAIGLYLAFADDEPAAQVYFAAADKDQATAAYDPCRIMAEDAHERGLLQDFLPYRSTKEIQIPSNPGAKVKALSSDTKKLYGLNLHGLIFDELMAQGANRVLWDALTTAQGARKQPLIFAITTAGWDKQSIAYEHREQTRRVHEGKGTAPHFLGVVYSLDEEADWTLPESALAAQPSMGWTVEPDYYERAVAEALEQPSAQNAVRTLYFCQWVGQADRIIPMEDWDSDDCRKAPAMQGPAWAGLDLASTTDLTALVLAFNGPDGTVDYVPHFFIPKDNMRARSQRDGVDYDRWVREGLVIATPGTVTDYGFVKAKVLELARDYDLRTVSYDAWGATQLAQELESEGVNMVPMRQGMASLAAPTKEFLRLIVARKVRHGGHPTLRWNADNMAGEQNAAGDVKPAKNRSAGRIDGVVAAIMATDGLMRGAGAPRRSVYEDHGPDDFWNEGDE